MVTNLFSREEVERKTLLILKILSESEGPVGSRVIARRMKDFGYAPSERAVRYHLKQMDRRGLTRLVGQRDGRVITEQGIDERGRARVRDKVGLAISRIESLAFETTFDPATGKGLLPVNISFFQEADIRKALRRMAPVFEAGFAVSDRVAMAKEGGRLGHVIVPGGKVGFATVCSIVVNGVLLKHGIPMDSKFGGILQMEDRRFLRFVELIHYSGSSLDPSEAFIRAGMTSVGSAVQTGNGLILANFREIPALCHPLMKDLLRKMKTVGVNGALLTGEVSEPVCQIPVDVNKIGVILVGGLNPIACVQESGIAVENRAMSTVMDFGELAPFKSVSRAGM